MFTIADCCCSCMTICWLRKDERRTDVGGTWCTSRLTGLASRRRMENESLMHFEPFSHVLTSNCLWRQSVCLAACLLTCSHTRSVYSWPTGEPANHSVGCHFAGVYVVLCAASVALKMQFIGYGNDARCWQNCDYTANKAALRILKLCEQCSLRWITTNHWHFDRSAK